MQIASKRRERKAWGYRVPSQCDCGQVARKTHAGSRDHLRKDLVSAAVTSASAIQQYCLQSVRYMQSIITPFLYHPFLFFSHKQKKQFYPQPDKGSRKVNHLKPISKPKSEQKWPVWYTNQVSQCT